MSLARAAISLIFSTTGTSALASWSDTKLSTLDCTRLDKNSTVPSLGCSHNHDRASSYAEASHCSIESAGIHRLDSAPLLHSCNTRMCVVAPLVSLHLTIKHWSVPRTNDHTSLCSFLSNTDPSLSRSLPWSSSVHGPTKRSLPGSSIVTRSVVSGLPVSSLLVRNSSLLSSHVRFEPSLPLVCRNSRQRLYASRFIIAKGEAAALDEARFNPKLAHKPRIAVESLSSCAAPSASAATEGCQHWTRSDISVSTMLSQPAPHSLFA
mmetsp:Transcript_12406/g.31140  ORF Transcript_12406/g.31140 Transcript_12406/m.31140 type:complete len:265 (+) Transcript_12406:1335-2129(+)